MFTKRTRNWYVWKFYQNIFRSVVIEKLILGIHMSNNRTTWKSIWSTNLICVISLALHRFSNFQNWFLLDYNNCILKFSDKSSQFAQYFWLYTFSIFVTYLSIQSLLMAKTSVASLTIQRILWDVVSVIVTGI